MRSASTGRGPGAAPVTSIVPVATEANLQVIVAHDPSPPVTSIRPYCGAELVSAVKFEDSRLYDGAYYDGKLAGLPVPAWTDVGMASHMRGICGLQRQSTSAWRSRGSVLPQALRPHLVFRECTFRTLLAISSFLENLFCWATYMEIKDPEKNLYNKFEAYALGAPSSLHTGVGVISALNTAYLFVFWVLVVVWRIDTHRALAFGRLPLSASSGLICLVVVFFSESTKVFPFLCTLCVLLHIQAVVLGGLLTRRGLEPTTSQRMRVFICTGVLVVIIAAWCKMYAFDGMAFLREDACRATKNRAMPVRIDGIDRWQCARWGKPLHIERLPPDGAQVFQAECTTSFHIFDAPQDGVNGTRLWRPSYQAHYVQCPPSCQAFGLGLEVVGCRVYDARSSICAAAVQVGVIDSETGGIVKVIGRTGPAMSQYERCNLNHVVSVTTADGLPGAQRIVARPSQPVTQAALDAESLPSSSNSTPNGTAVSGNRTLLAAFYFQEVPGSAEADMVTLHGFRRISVPGPKEPYLSYVADVSWRVGGGEVKRREVPLGPGPASDIELNFCHDGSAAAPNRCD